MLERCKHAHFESFNFSNYATSTNVHVGALLTCTEENGDRPGRVVLIHNIYAPEHTNALQALQEYTDVMQRK